MTTASKETFIEQIQSGKLKNDKQIIYSAIKKNPGITLIDLKRLLKMEHQTVSARLSDLFDLGVIEVLGTQQRIGSISVSYDSILKVQEDLNEIRKNQLLRSEKKFQRAIKTVLSYKEHLDEETINSLVKHLKIK